MHLTEVKRSGESSFWGNPLETIRSINKGKSRELKKQRVSTKRKSTEKFGMIPREHSDLYLLLSFISLYDVPFSSIGRTGYSFFEEEYINTDGARALCLYFMKDMNLMRRNLIKIRSSAIFR